MTPCLVEPVLTYGCQVWLSSRAKHLTREAPANPTEVLKKIAGDEAWDPQEDIYHRVLGRQWTSTNSSLGNQPDTTLREPEMLMQPPYSTIYLSGPGEPAT